MHDGPVAGDQRTPWYTATNRHKQGTCMHSKLEFVTDRSLALTRLAVVFATFAFTPLIAAAATKHIDERVALVAKIYRDYAWEAVIDEPDFQDRRLMQQPKEVLRRYFDDKLVQLILDDRRCAERTGEICNLDYEPVWASQDPGASELKVTAGTDPAVVDVSFRYPSTQEEMHLRYRLSGTKRGWRVSDIEGPSGNSLLMDLGRKP